jgi:hypothetical protein
MRRLAAAFVAVAAGLSAALPASADTFTDCFDAVSVEVNERIAALPVEPVTKEEKAELKALNSVRKVLDREYRTLNLAVDAKGASKIVKTLFKAYPEDAEIAVLLDGLVDCLETDCLADHEALGVLINALPEGRKKDGLVAAHTVVAGKLGLLAALGPTTDRARAVVPIANGLVSLRKRYGKVVAAVAGKGGVTAVINKKSTVCEDVNGVITLDAEGAVVTVSVTGTLFLPTTGETRTVNFVLQGLVGGFVETGVYDVSGLPVVFTYATLGGPNPPVNMTANAGTLTLMTLDDSTGSVAGQFDCTGFDNHENPVTMKVKFNLTGLTVDAP